MATINGTPNNDTLEGTSGDDTINGLGGNDTINGGAGRDTIRGGDGDDTIDAGDGDDIVWDESGRSSTVWLGAGNDLLTVRIASISASDRVTIDGGAGSDSITFEQTGPGRATIDGGADGGMVHVGAIASGGLTLTNIGAVYFYHLQPLVGTGVITFTNFTAGNMGNLFDIKTFAINNLQGTGYDNRQSPFDAGIVRLTQSGNDVILQIDRLGNGVFSTFVIFQNEVVADFVDGNFFPDLAIGGGGQGRSLLNLAPVTTINGTVDPETLGGTAGRDIITGGGGADIIDGGRNNDVLTGGAGADIFRFTQDQGLAHSAGSDRITDFNVAEDKLDLTHYGIRYLNDITSLAVQDGANVVFHISLRETLTLENVTLSQLTANNFVGLYGATATIDQIGHDPAATPILTPYVLSQNATIAAGQTVFGRFANGLVTSADAGGMVNLVNNGTLWVHNASSAYIIDGAGRELGYALIDNNGTMVAIADNANSVIGASVLNFEAGSGFAHLDNSGTMQALSRNGSATTIFDIDRSASIVNSGLIAARGDFEATAILRTDGGFIENTATGRIIAEGGNFLYGEYNYSGATAIYLGGTTGPENGKMLVNAGLIEARATGVNPSAAIVMQAGLGSIDNSGTIRADIAIASSSGNLIVNNLASGRIFGEIQLGVERDVINNAGTITGGVYMSEGNDLVDTTQGRINGLVDLGIGSDEFRGSSVADVVLGGRGADLLLGNNGNDLLLGGFDNDELRGGAGNDGLYGEFGDDVIHSLGSDDVLAGSGNDRVLAGDFRFALIDGGRGFDTLTFASGARTIDLLTAVDDGRLRGVESYGLSTGQTLILRQGSVGASLATDATIQVTTGSSAATTLVGGWQLDGTAVVEGVSFQRYRLGGETVLVGAGVTVSIVASLAAQASGLDAISGAAAPQPGIIPGADLSSNAYIGDMYNPGSTFTITEDELWLGSPTTSNTIFSGHNFEGILTNNGVILQDTDFAVEAVSFFYMGGIVNNGSILIDHTRISDTPSASTAIFIGGSGFIDNRGVIGTYSISNHSFAIRTWADRITNSGEIYSISENGQAMGIYTVNGQPIINHGLLFVESGHSLATAIQSDRGFIRIENYGRIEAVTGSDTVRSIGILMPAPQVLNHSGNGYILNEGTITADIAIAARANDLLSSDNGYEIVNRGTINGDIDLAYRPDGPRGDPNGRAQFVVNSGQIVGNAYLGGGADVFDGRLGTVNGTVFGEEGDDELIGGAGNDIFNGGVGNDRMAGGRGNDTYFVDSANDLIFENAGEGNDSVTASVGYYLHANVEKLTLATGAGNIFGVGNDLANTIVGNAGSNLLLGGVGDDVIRGGAGGDSLFGEAGVDQLFGDAGIDYLVGGLGHDILDGGADADALYGEDGDDTLIGGAGFFTDILVGGAGNDILRGNSGLGDYDLMDGGAGNDSYYVDTPDDLTFEAVGGGTDTVYANINGAGYYLYANVENLVLEGNTPFGVGNDLANRLTGNATGNYLLGGRGNDTLNGKAGNDVLFGEGGADTFVFERGTGGDVIGDFARGTDKIDLSAFGFASFAALQAGFTQVGANGAINLGNGDFIVLHNVTMSQLTQGDFILSAMAPKTDTFGNAPKIADDSALSIDAAVPAIDWNADHWMHRYDIGYQLAWA